MDKIKLKVLIKRAILDGIKYHYEMAELGRGSNFDQFAEDRIKDFELACVGECSDESSGLHKHIVGNNEALESSCDVVAVCELCGTLMMTTEDEHLKCMNLNCNGFKFTH